MSSSVAGQLGGASMSMFKWTEDDQTHLDSDAVLEIRSSPAVMRPMETLDPQTLGDFVPRTIDVTIEAPAELETTESSVGWATTHVSPQRVVIDHTDTTSDSVADVFQRVSIVPTSVEHNSEYMLNVTVRGDNAIPTPLPDDYSTAFRSIPIDDTHVRILYTKVELATFQTSILEATVDLVTGEVTPGLTLIDRSTANGTMLGAEEQTLVENLGAYASLQVSLSGTRIVSPRTIVCSLVMTSPLRYRFVIFDLVNQTSIVYGLIGAIDTIANPWFALAAETATPRWFVVVRSTDDEDLHVYTFPVHTNGQADYQNPIISHLTVAVHGSTPTSGDSYSLLTIDDSDPDPLLHKLYFRIGAEQNVSTPNTRYVYGAAGSELSITGVLPEQANSRYVGRGLVADSYGVQFGLPWAHRIGHFTTNFVSLYMSHADFASATAEGLLQIDVPLVDGVPAGPLRDTFAQILQTVDIDIDDANLTLLPVRVHKLSENETEVRLLIACTAMGDDPFWNYSVAAIATRTKGPDFQYTSCVPLSSVGVQHYSNYASNGSLSIGPPESNMVSTLGSNALLNLYLEPTTLTRRVRVMNDDDNSAEEDDDDNSAEEDDEPPITFTSGDDDEDDEDDDTASNNTLLWWHWLLIAVAVVIALGTFIAVMYFKFRSPHSNHAVAETVRTH